MNVRRPGRDLLILLLGVLPSLVLGVAWMRLTGVPSAVYLQNVVGAIVGVAIAVYGMRRDASSKARLAIVIVAIALLLATLIGPGMQGVHRWIRIGPLTLHVASLAIPVVLAELDRILRDARLRITLGIMLTIAMILAIQPDAGQATAFAGACIVLLAARRSRIAIAGILVLLTLAGLSFLRTDPLAPVPYVEEIAVRIAQRGAIWAAAVVIALVLLIVPFLVRPRTAIAVYFVLAIAASYWGHFPVPVLGYGMSPILGYFAGWTWLRAREIRATSLVE